MTVFHFAHVRGRPLFLLSILLFVPLCWILLSSRSSSGRLGPIDPSYGRLPTPSSSSGPRNAFATFLDDSSSGKSEDYYFAAARILTYQLLYANETKCANPTPFIVLVTSGVAQHKRRQLEHDGAIILEAESVPLPWWVWTTNGRWKNQFTKLRLLQQTQYDRIAFIDADHIITRPLDDIFDDAAVHTHDTQLETRQSQIRADEAKIPSQYVFAARTDNRYGGGRSHPVPPPSGDQFSAGFWVAAPSHALYSYLMSVIKHPWRFSPQTMEQSLLNYAFRRDGAMPWSELDYRWSATYPNEDDFGAGVATLHEKFWLGRGPQMLQDLWWSKKAEMEAYFSGARVKVELVSR